MDMSTFATIIVSIAGGLVTIDKAYDIIMKRIPSTELRTIIDKHTELLERDKIHLERHDEEIRKLNEDVRTQVETYANDRRIMLKCLLTTLRASSGDVDKQELREVIKELEDYLTK